MIEDIGKIIGIKIDLLNSGGNKIKSVKKYFKNQNGLSTNRPIEKINHPKIENITSIPEITGLVKVKIKKVNKPKQKMIRKSTTSKKPKNNPLLL